MPRKRAHPDLIEALRQTANRLSEGAEYRWTHMGSCNCGHLAQTVTRLPKEEIHRQALQKAGDWGEQALDFCPTSGYPIDHLIGALIDLGLTREDLWHLERLSDPDVLRRLPVGERELCCRRRNDVVVYLQIWASLLEDEWMAGVGIPANLSGLPVWSAF